MDAQSLASLLVWLYSGGGASTLTYRIMEKVNWLASLQAEYKRYASWALTAVLVAVPFGIAVWFGYEPAPATGQHWAEVLIPMILLAITAGQLVHARLALSKR